MDIPKLRWIPLDIGGTWITDFPLNRQSILEQVIQEQSREDLVICNIPLMINIPDEPHGSIHSVGNHENLSTFLSRCAELVKDKN